MDYRNQIKGFQVSWIYSQMKNKPKTIQILYNWIEGRTPAPEYLKKELTRITGRKIK